MRRVLALTLLLPAAAGMAQDYDPSMAAHEAMSQQQQVTGSSAIQAHMLNESVRRNNRPGYNARTAATCANVPKVRKRLGANNPDVRKLAALCKQAGY